MPIDLRNQKLAKLIVEHSIKAKPGERVLITGSIEAQDLIFALYKELILKGTHPITKISIPGTAPFYYKYAKPHQLNHYPDVYDYMVKHCQKIINIISSHNTKELTNIDPKKLTDRTKVTKPISDYIHNNSDKVSWVLVPYPCPALAQEAEMSETEYEKFVYDACLIDWKKLIRLMEKIKSKFKNNSKVHLIGEGVDLKFKVLGHKAVIGDGTCNMPDGEVFMAPIKDSINGYIRFEYPAIRGGKEVTGIELKFKDGKVVESNASKNQDFLKQMLNVDEGSSYVGEFGIGCNAAVKKFTKELLFDEKMGGTIHLALGKSYKENGETNDSAIHWDIVKDMSNAKMIVDGKVIQENGKWKL